MNGTTEMLLEAVENDDVELTKQLLQENGEIPETINKLHEGRTLLSWACSRCCYGNVKALLDAGADATIAGPDGRRALDYACSSEYRNLRLNDIIALLLRSGADIDGRDNMGKTALLWACEVDDSQTVQYLIDNACDINVQTVCGYSPMRSACKNAEFWFYWHGHQFSTEPQLDPRHYPPLKIALMLLRAGVDNNEATLLPTAIQFSYNDLVTELLDAGMNVNLLDDSKRTPLGSACATAKVPAQMVRKLLEYGADVNIAGGWKKQKPIILAYVHNSIDKMRLLLSYGAHVTPEEMTELVSLTLSKSILENPDIVGPHSPELLSWQLLIFNGFRPLLQGKLMAKVQQLRMCSSYKSIGPLINDLLHPILSLKDSCRVAIRRLLPPCKDTNVEELPIPEQVMRYLQFDDF